MGETNSQGSSALAGYDYCGWIPCLSGNLDFSFMDVGLAGAYFPEPTDALNSVIAWLRDAVDPDMAVINYPRAGGATQDLFPCRRVVLNSWVEWRDVIKADGQFNVIAIGEVDSHAPFYTGAMRGYVCIYPRAYGRKRKLKVDDDAGRARGQAHADIYAILDQMVVISGRTEEERSALDAYWSELDRRFASGTPLGQSPHLDEVYVVEYEISADGLVFMKYVNDAVDASSRSDGHQSIIVRQAFYYLKYSLHRHKHHGRQADALTTTVACQKETPHAVSMALFSQLKREIVSGQRRAFEVSGSAVNAPNAAVDPIGVATYARALVAACHGRGWLDALSVEKLYAGLDRMVQSFSAASGREEKQRHQEQEAMQAARQWAALLLAYIGLMAVAYVNLFGADARLENPEDRADGLLKWLVGLDGAPLVFLFLFGVAVLVASVRMGKRMFGPVHSWPLVMPTIRAIRLYKAVKEFGARLFRRWTRSARVS